MMNGSNPLSGPEMSTWATRSAAYLALGAIVVGASWLGLHRVGSITFLFDQARDLLYVDGVVRSGQLPGLGPHISTGGYLGPFMIYFLVPVRLFSTAPEAFAGFIGATNVLAILVAFHIGRRYFNPRAGLIAALLLGYTGYAVMNSTGIWNPYLVPFFSSLLILAVFRCFVDGAERWLVAIGVSASILLQLHASTVVLLPYVALAWWTSPFPRPNRSVVITTALLSGTLFLPPLLFDLTNDFYNLRSILAGLSRVSSSSGSLWGRTLAFFSTNVFTSEAFLAGFLLGLGLLLSEYVAPRSVPAYRRRLLLLALPASCFFVAMVVWGGVPLTHRSLQGLMVPSAVLGGVAVDEAARRIQVGLSLRPLVVDSMLLAGAVLYAALVVHSVTSRPVDVGHGYLGTMRRVANILIDDAGDRDVLSANVYVCERAPVAEYGKGYAYLLLAEAEARDVPHRGGSQAYLVSPVIAAPGRSVANVDGVHVARFSDVDVLQDFVRDYPQTRCHWALPQPFPFRSD